MYNCQFECKWKDPELRKKILELVRSLCNVKNVRLLYLVFFGSALYGTDTTESDIDVKGLFVPDLETLLLGDAPRSIHDSTGDSAGKNSPDDVDIELWSLRYWLLDLLKKGDTGAVDLLYSHTSSACILYKAQEMDWIFQNAGRLINTTLAEAASKYALHQAKKYGIKGSRLGMFRKLKKWLEEHENKGRLAEIIPQMIPEFENDQFFRQGPGFIVTGGKTHIDSISIGEFKKRIDQEVAKYGNRAEEAFHNSGVDFKALSHALRAIGQMKELLTTGEIVYPLSFRHRLIEVKSGKFPWPEVEPMILAEIKDLESMNRQAGGLTWDEEFAKGCVVRISKGIIPAEYAIQKLLDEVEKTENIRILMAVESGSRAWGMASEDSDYDVRFVYMHNVDWYLDSCVRPRKKTITLFARNAQAGKIDAEGWDITKALSLFARSNPSLMEWVASPIVYRSSQPFLDLMRTNMHYAWRVVAIYHHYWKMGHNSWKHFQARGDLKSLCYAIRGMLMALYVKKSPNISKKLPMDIKALMDEAILYLPDSLEGKNALLADIEMSINLKRHSEKTIGASTRAMQAFMEYMLRENHPDLPVLKTDAAIERTEIEIAQIFRTILKYAWG